MTNRKGTKRGPNHETKLKVAPHRKNGKVRALDAASEILDGVDWRPKEPHDIKPTWDFSDQNVKARVMG